MKRITVLSVGVVLVASLGVLGLSSVASARGHHNGAAGGAPIVASVSPNTGPFSGGTLVNIDGRNLAGTTAVTFGSVASPYVVNRSRHRVQAIAPPAGTASVVDVQVTTSAGTSAVVARDQFTYVSAPTIQSVRPQTGGTTGGDQVTISGAGFSDVTAVDFGSAPAAFTVDSTNAISAITPAGSAGTVNVTVTTGDGTSPIGRSDQFTYVLAAPVVTSVVFDVGSTSGGDAVTITGNRFTNPATVYFGATKATSVTVKNAHSITATSPAGSGTVDVTVVTTAGTSAVSQPVDEFEYSATAS
ncbi:MAG TPA: IPT/TIG domain-containing protein [Acidimicrobiales bacterium]|nr:IPT/TIG domain-containing protein [Acidimicrobiales bacterium]